MSGISGLIACATIQDQLNGNFRQLTNQAVEPSPFLGVLTSEMNAANTLQRQINTGTGKLRKVEVIYEQRLQEDVVESDATLNCDGGTTPTELSHEYELDPHAGSSVKWSIAPHDLIYRCEADEIFFARQLQKYIDVLVRKINTDSITKAITLVGNFATSGTDTAKVLTTRNAAGTDTPDVIEKIRFEYMEMGFMGAPIVFGGSETFYNYFNRMPARCCQTTFGIDIGTLYAQNSLMAVYDRKINSIMGSDELLSIAPGALQLITWNEFKSSRNTMNLPNVVYGTIVDPVTGLEFDYYAEFSCGTWNFQLKLAHDVVAMPDDMFAASDRLNGVNWVNQWVITNPELA